METSKLVQEQFELNRMKVWMDAVNLQKAHTPTSEVDITYADSIIAAFDKAFAEEDSK